MYAVQAGLCLLALSLVCCEGKPYSKKGKVHHVKSRYFYDDLPPVVPVEKREKKDETWMAWNQAPAAAKDPKTLDLGNGVDLTDKKKQVELPQSSDPCRNVFCHYGRVCSTSAAGEAKCVCAGEDFCKDHKKSVCGSDGFWYPSHCELHRMACVKEMHISIDHTEQACLAFRKQVQIDPVSGSESESCSIISLPGGAALCVLNIQLGCFGLIDCQGKVITVASDKTSAKITPAIAVLKLKDTKVTVKAQKEKVDVEQIKQQDKEDALNKKLKEEGKKDAELKQEQEEQSQDVAKEVEDIVRADVLTQHPESQDDVACFETEYSLFKNSLLKYHCAIIGERDCMQDSIKAQFLANIMFNYYDHDNDKVLSLSELEDIEHRNHLEKLSQLCSLTDLLSFDDLEPEDGHINMDEFLTAFGIDTVILDDDLKVFTTQVTVGNSVELKCDIQGAADLAWKRNGASLDDITTTDIKVFEDGSLYLNNLGLHHMANYTCQDRSHDRIVQTHVLKVQMPPKVTVSPNTQFHTTGSSVRLQCHADGVPEPSIQWEMNEMPLEDDARHYLLLHNNATLEIRTATYTKDTGAYKCLARNTAGSAQDIATVFIEDADVPKYSDSSLASNELFVVFHDNGYSIYEPTHCHLDHMVTAGFSNFNIPPQYGTTASMLCKGENACVWGEAINVQNKYVYITQPTLNRVVVIDVAERSNPAEVIPTDSIPVSIHYVEHLDQVWVLCWNQEADSGSKTAVIIRQASQDAKHHTIHTQPIGDRFDLIQDLFTPPSNDLGHKFQYGYVTHQDQQRLYKLDLQAMKYVSDIDLKDYECVPKSVAFIPLGGQVLVHCMGEQAQRLMLDYITDKVLEHTELDGEPYLSPDTRYLVLVDNRAGTITVNRVNDNGNLEQLYEEYINMKISDVSFFHSEHGHGYNLYASSANKDEVLYMNLASGKVEIVQGVGEPASPSEWEWSKHSRSIKAGGVFSQFLISPSRDAAVIIDGQRRQVQCEWQNIKHANVVVWVEQRHNL